MTIHLPKINGVGGGAGGGGGDGKFPIIVTDSGSSLPSASGYQEGDTFLNTTDKKIYTTQVGGYQYNTNVSVTDTVAFEETTGAISSSSDGYIKRTRTGVIWKGSSVSFKIHFKFSSIPSISTGLFESQNTITNNNGKGIGVAILNSKLFFLRTAISSATGNWYSVSSTNIFGNDFSLETDKDYFLKITKNDTVASAELHIDSEDGETVASSTFETEDWYTWEGYNGLSIVYYLKTLIYTTFSVGKIYLFDSSYEFVIPDTTTLFWDSGTSLTDKTEYADKTNGALYLYENSELVKIPQNKIFTDVYVNSWVADSTYADYGYKCEITNLNGVTSNMFAQVIFAPAQADSGNYATVCLTGNGTVTIYSKVNDAISIPSIVVMGV